MGVLIYMTALLAALALTSSSIVQPRSGDNFELLILHNNDMHARFEQTSQLSGACTTADREAGKCYGGFPRVAHVVKEARKAAQTGQGPPVLYLNAGDTYTGTAWFTIYKWKIAAEFINALQPDAVALGNNDLENGSEDFLQNINTTILSCNVILKSDKQNNNIEKSFIIDVEGVKVGIVGYLTPDSNMLDSTGDIEYIDEIIALKEEVAKLQKVNVYNIIALGHSNIDRDIEIAREVDGLSLVIGGYRNTYFWNGTNACLPEHQPYKLIRQTSGRVVPVTQSFSYDKYLGQIIAEFNVNGEVTKYDSNPILLDLSIPEDPEATQIAKRYNKEITERSDEILGSTSVVLDGSNCNVEECNLGNLITDAMMYYHAIRFEGERWTDAPIAVIHGGAIAGSIAPSDRPASVTRGDLLSALPLESNVVAVSMNGTIFNQVLEHSVGHYSLLNPTGQLLQFSGVRAVFDLSREPGSRLVDAVVRCWACFIPEYYVIDDWRIYKILMPASLADGEFGYSMLVGLERENFAYDELTCTAEYMSLRSPVYPEIADRIVLRNVDSIIEDAGQPDSATALSSTILFIALLPFMNVLNF